MKINPGNARGLLVPQGDRPFSFVVYSSEIRDFGLLDDAFGRDAGFILDLAAYMIPELPADLTLNGYAA